MRPRTVLVLLLLVAGLGAFVWLYERELPGSDERGEQAKKVFADLEADEVTRVTITSAAGTVELERPALPATDGDGEAEDPEPALPAARAWRIVRPLAALADGSRVDALLSTLAGLEKVRTLDDVEASAVGLDAPEASIELDTTRGERRLLLGSEVPAGGGRIVGTGEAPPYFVVVAAFQADLERAPGDWRSRDLFPGERSAIERITLARGAERLLLARRGEDFWVESPYVDRADAGTVNRLLGALTGLAAERFLDQPPPDADLGLAPPAAVVEAVLEGEAEPLEVEVGGAVPDQDERVYARVGGLTVETAGSLAEATGGGPADWRSLAWAGLEVFEIDRVEVAAAGAAPLTLERAEGEWTRDGQKIDFAAASDFLYALTAVKADAVGDPVALGEPQLTFVLESEERAETLELFAAREAGRPARVSDREVVLWLGADGVAEVEKRLDGLRAAPVTETIEPTTDAATGADATDAATGESNEID